MPPRGMTRGRHRVTATIAASGTVSDMVNIGDYAIAAIVFPNGWTAADLRFQSCEEENGTYAPVHGDDGNRVTIASASLPTAEKRIFVNKAILEQLSGLHYLKLDASVAQGAQRLIHILLKA